ncbi:MAG: P-loop NTPase [Actinomycetota bacterium]
MDPIEYLRVLRRRWVVIGATVLLALIVAWTTTAVIPVGDPVRTYQARVVILNTGPLNVPGISTLGTVAALTTVGDVPIRVAETLGYEGHPADLAAKVSASATEEGLLHITAVSSDAQEAKELANAFGDELLEFLSDRKTELIAKEASFLQKNLEQLQKDMTELQGQIAFASASRAELLTQTLNAKLQIFGVISQRRESLVSAAAEPGTLLIVQEAEPQEIVQPGFQPPSSRGGRLVFAGVLGLFAGVILALLIDRIDVRIRDRKSVERHYRFPVLSEIPSIPHGNGIATSSEPTSPPADAFRILAASLVHPPSPNGDGAAAPFGGVEGPQTILVTSAARGEGKTSVVANLGAAFSQLGKRVVILSCDFRYPTLDHVMEVDNGTGLADLLRKRWNGQRIVESYLKATSLAGVFVVPSGPIPPKPSSLLAAPSMQRVLEEARGLSDVVLLDTPAVLLASDAAHLVEEVDSVLVVSRAGYTTVDQAERVGELLRRLDAPVIGVAFNEAPGVTDWGWSGGLRQVTQRWSRGFHGLRRHWRER